MPEDKVKIIETVKELGRKLILRLRKRSEKGNIVGIT